MSNRLWQQETVYLFPFTCLYWLSTELLAAQWPDIDFTEKKITIGKTLATDEFGKIVIQTPKKKSSERTLELDN